AAAVERGSEHPLAEAILARAAADRVTPAGAADFEALPGHGVTARVEGRAGVLGHVRPMTERGLALDGLATEAERLEAEGEGAVGAMGGGVAGGDVLKPEAAATVAAPHRLGIEVVMLTGDARRTAEAIGRQAGVDRVLAEVPPEGKADEVERLQAGGRLVAMV